MKSQKVANTLFTRCTSIIRNKNKYSINREYEILMLYTEINKSHLTRLNKLIFCVIFHPLYMDIKKHQFSLVFLISLKYPIYKGFSQ